MKSPKHRQQKLPDSLLRSVIRIGRLAVLCLVLFALSAWAGKPEYLKLKLKPGQAVEVKGYWDTTGVFIASDIEKLPKPRRPKLRGAIQSINAEKKIITVYGQQIEIDSKTKFDEVGGEEVTFDELKVGQRVEVSCKVSRRGEWEAKSVKTNNVKSSNKIKGTINRVSLDGNAPDSIFISRDPRKEQSNDSIQIPGIIILLVPSTDANDEHSFIFWIEKELYGDLSNPDANELFNDGIVLNEKVFVSGEYRPNLRNQREYDLSARFDNDRDETEQEARIEMHGYLSPDAKVLGKLRIRKRYHISVGQNLPSSPYETDLIQLYFLAPNIGGKGVGLQVGRQDFDEPREWLFDEYLDAVRLYYFGTDPLVFETALIYGGESFKDKFQTWTDIFASVRVYLDRKSFVSAYFLARSDSDDIVRNREPVWWGLRYYGNVDKTLRPWADLAIMRGEDKFKPLNAWALDIGATARARYTPLEPSVTAAFAFGSGDESGDLTNQRFRQTGYDDNVDYFGGVTSLKYYGAVLSPELSNIKILTVGVGVRPTEKSSIDVVYHKYNQHYAEADIKGSSLLLDPFGNSTDIGSAFDVVVGLPKLWDHIRLRWTGGMFMPGDAFLPFFVENAFLSKIDLKIGF